MLTREEVLAAIERDYNNRSTAVTAKRDLADLVSKGVLVQRGATRNIRYEPGESEPPPNDPKVTRK